MLKFCRQRLGSALATVAEYPQLRWFVERTVAAAATAATTAAGGDRAFRNPVQLVSRKKSKRSHSTRLCANPMCLARIIAYRGAPRGSAGMAARRRAARGSVCLDHLQPQLYASVNGHRAGNGLVCSTCELTPHAVYTTRQVPLGFKYCGSCRCFHHLRHFSTGPWSEQYGRIAGAVPSGSQSAPALFSPSCFPSQRHYNHLSWGSAAAPLPRPSEHRRTRALASAFDDATTTIGPYSDLQHIHTGASVANCCFCFVRDCPLVWWLLSRW